MKARVLSVCQVAGKTLLPNQIIEATKKIISVLEANGAVDSSAAAVEYAMSLGSTPVDVAADPAEADQAPATGNT